MLHCTTLPSFQAKNFNAAGPLMARISSAKLQLQFAKAKEAEGRWVCYMEEWAWDQESDSHHCGLIKCHDTMLLVALSSAVMLLLVGAKHVRVVLSNNLLRQHDP
jgi:hypothetical protein